MEKKVKIKLPSVPNFLLNEQNISIPIREFTEEELRELGAEWIEALVAKSKKLPV